jgi:hypothetical protein
LQKSASKTRGAEHAKQNAVLILGHYPAQQRAAAVVAPCGIFAKSHHGL